MDDLTADAKSGMGRMFRSKKNLSIQRAVKYLRRNVLTVRRDKTTGLVSVAVVWTDPQQAAEWVNAYIGMADSLMRERAQRDAERSLALLKEELTRAQRWQCVKPWQT